MGLKLKPTLFTDCDQKSQHFLFQILCSLHETEPELLTVVAAISRYVCLISRFLKSQTLTLLQYFLWLIKLEEVRKLINFNLI